VPATVWVSFADNNLLRRKPEIKATKASFKEA
jgi:hypothetical protein